MTIAISVHLLAAVIWVGGMFFSLQVLRPSCLFLEPPLRLQLTMGVMNRFFKWVWLLVTALVATGWLMVSSQYAWDSLPWHVGAMLVAGHVMLFVFLYAWFVPFQKARTAVNAEDRPTAGKHLDQIRKLITLNLSLGMILVLAGSAGRYF